ncbi:class II fructose-bisphosphate aldolase [Candidatus Saccharibacteria bacterium]|nr:class II fructose-bisphosphate aldolase [Candidatus Saccharibacteria bacterium]
MSVMLQQIRKNCEQAREAFDRARKGHYALGAFNLDNQETLKAVTLAAKAMKAPVLVEVSKGEADALGLNNVRDMVDNYKADYGVEMYINLDHSPTVDDAIAGITAGFECIHIDISQAKHGATDREIIEETRKVVKAAKLTGAIVEAEPHYFGGSSNLHTEKIDYTEIRKTFSTPEGAKAFVEATGIDTFAAAIGNLHGHYPVPKVLDLDLLRQIRAAIDCNISLHGGSGTAGHYFVEAAKIGVTKININSDMRIAYRDTLEKVLDENKTEYAVVKLMDEVIKAVQKVVEKKIGDFNSAGKARI